MDSTWLPAGAFAVGATWFGVAERLRPRVARAWPRSGFARDVAFLLINGPGLDAVVGSILRVLAAALATVVASDAPRFAAAGLPLPVEIVAGLLLFDFLYYWQHRLLHRVPALWELHKVHHCSAELDWLSNYRAHALDVALTYTTGYLVMLPLGFSAPALAAVAAIDIVDGMWTHANLRGGYRALRGLLITPELHRSHHSAEPDSLHCNYAMMFSLWDRLFGTLHAPAAGPGERFGVAFHPELADRSLWEHEIAPFRLLLRRPSGAPADGSTGEPNA